jgi:hypothetical protein
MPYQKVTTTEALEMRGMVFQTYENRWMKDRSDSLGHYCMAWRSTSLPGQAYVLSKLALSWWHNTPQEVRDPSGKFMSHDLAMPVKATGK